MSLSLTIISVMAVILFSFACAILRRGHSFSMNVFLSSISIGIAILVWIPIIPTFCIIVSLAIPGLMLFGDRGDNPIE